jgi:hypothetical protein
VRKSVDPRQEVLDLGALVEEIAGVVPRAMVTLEARYDERVFPYRPHHLRVLHRPGSDAPPLYYAVNAVLGGVPRSCRRDHHEQLRDVRLPPATVRRRGIPSCWATSRGLPRARRK